MDPSLGFSTQCTQNEDAEPSPSAIEVVDNLEINEEFKKAHLQPYLEQIYESILLRTRTRSKGIPSYAFSEVLFYGSCPYLTPRFIVSLVAWLD